MEINVDIYKKIEVVDLFCGIGGLSYGMKSKGFVILAGYDLDETCRFAYETNNKAEFHYQDVKNISGKDILKYYSNNSIKVLAGCAPCQPFSTYAHTKKQKIRINMIYCMSLVGWFKKSNLI